MTKTATTTDIYTRVTNRIIADLEQGVRPWLKPWSAEHAAGRILRPLRHNGEPYAGINILLLWGAAEEHGFASPTWMTYRQAAKLGAQVRKGETGSLVVYTDSIHKTDTDENGQESERNIHFMKGYTVFNVEQIDGLPEHYHTPATAPLTPEQRHEAGERFMAATGATIRHGGDRAYYSPANDHVQLPPFLAFHDPESYYATALHELTHWTRHPSRLDRDFGRKQWGDQGYAREELVAELGAAFLCADLGITPEPRPDHAAYLASWLEVLKGDKRAIFTAATHASKAAAFLAELVGVSQVATQVAT